MGALTFAAGKESEKAGSKPGKPGGIFNPSFPVWVGSDKVPVG